MTEGPILSTILLFAVPMLIGNVFEQGYNLVDTMISGHYLGDQAIAAIGATSAIYSLLMSIVWGMNNGFCIMLARSFGAGDMKRFKNAVATTLVLDLGVAVVMTSAFIAFLKPVMKLLKTPDEIFNRAYTYIVIILVGLVGTILYNMCAGYLRSIGNSKVPLYFLIVSSVLNLSMDVIFIIIFKMGIAGTALATIIAQAVSGVGSLIYILKNYQEYLPQKEDFRLQGALVSEMLTMGLSMALMQSVFSIGSVIMQRAINQLGTEIITAHTSAKRIYEMLMIPMGSFSTSNATFVGQNYGARKLARIRTSNKLMFLVEFCWSALSIIAAWTVGKYLIVWLAGTSEKVIVDNAYLMLRIATACFAPLGCLFVLRNAMQSMGHKVLPVLSSSIELGFKVVSATWIVPKLGYLGVAITEPITWIVCPLFLFIFYCAIGHQKDNPKEYTYIKFS